MSNTTYLCPVCSRPLRRFEEQEPLPPEGTPPRYFCPDLLCDATPSPMTMAAMRAAYGRVVTEAVTHFAGVPIEEFCGRDYLRIQAMAREGKIGIAGLCAACSAKVDAATPAAPAVEHPVPWRWDDNDDTALRDAAGDVLACVSQGQQWIIDARVRALTAAAPQLYSGVIALLGIINDTHHNNWPARGLFPEDTGPICANLRLLLAGIDEASK